MDVTSWLNRRKGGSTEEARLHFANMELMKDLRATREQLVETEKRFVEAQSDVNSLTSRMEELDEEVIQENQKAALAVARVSDLQERIHYLEEQVKIYQVRLGLLPQERQGTSEGKETKPLRKARVPFNVVAARVQTDRTEAYWKARAEAASAVMGTTTQTDTPAVSDKELV